MLDWEMEALVVLLVSNLTLGLKEEPSFSVYIILCTSLILKLSKLQNLPQA